MDAGFAGTWLPLLVVLGGLALAAAVIKGQPWWAERRRSRQGARPFPLAWRRILRRRVPLAARLPAALQLRLKRQIQIFLADKTFIGCQGQSISDDVRVTIAALACLPLLGQVGTECYPRLRQVLVYPSAFVVEREHPDAAGLVQQHRRALAGESWGQGQVILAWDEVVRGAADPADGRNVVLHEFAHQIDQDSGAADGRPWQPGAAARRRWASVMGDALDRLRCEPSALIDAYGASEPAEFFAVVTEVFFERPTELATEAPAVYAELAGFYRLDPASW
ncbi:zinc-dependent peptidase [Piscinibacter koreensis]|uniref:Zinc-dependent peptidase n=1 Tax=Piscinibacter koreensis TaxID=2742824 RepID=A0A7Y6NJB1_9BURK|nr:M90 family metallopeptidase [Schlegelella koreensis]NUZ04240.1 zinc-dependent peptidase [Schlegelella koreensis]